MIDQQVVQVLRDSKRDFKAVYPVLYCAQHPEYVISGRHRAAAEWDVKQPVDVEKWAKQWNVPHDAAHEIMRDRLNVQRTVTKEERADSMIKVARMLGTEKGKVVEKVHNLFPHFSERYIYELLPAEFKEEKKAEARKETTQKFVELSSTEEKSPVAENEPESGELGKPQKKKEPYSKGQRPSPKEGLKPQYTTPQMKLAAAFNKVGLFPDVEKPFERLGEFTKEYIPKTYVADLHFGPEMVIIEVEGKGSASADNDERELFFTNLHYQMVHVPNSCAKSHGRIIAAVAAAFTRKGL